ncbi:hypothetical protein [Rhizobium sp.]
MPVGRERVEQLERIIAELTRLRRLVPDDHPALSDWLEKAISEASMQMEHARAPSLH